MHHENLKTAKPYLIRSAQLFKKIKDDNNYVVVMCHVLQVNVKEGNFEKADLVIKELLEKVKNNKWFGTEQTLYKNISNRYLLKQDSLNYYKWFLKEKDAGIKLSNARNNREMSYYRVGYETEKYKSQVKLAKLETKDQKIINIILLAFIFVFLIFIIVVFLLLLKKNKLSKSLEISNEKFQLLMIESNHRIKNNLQMILSMVDYSNEELNDKDSKILNKISSKIKTVSLLHKHLYADVHNEFVSISIYFEEIINLYTKIFPDKIEITTEIISVQIKSERIVYFGLILNELLANTVEHNKAKVKKVYISVKPFLDSYLFEYDDNSFHKNSETKSTGTILLNQLVKRVKGKNFQLDKKTGTYKFNFKDVI